MSPTRMQSLEDARRLRNLGRYTEALSKFRAAQARQDGYVLRAEIGGMFLEQGYILRGYQELESHPTSQSERDADPIGYAVADMVLYFSTAAATVHFSDQLQAAVALYETHLAGLTVSGFSRKHMIMLCLYAGLISIASGSGIDIAYAPRPSVVLLSDLFFRAVKEGWLRNALSFAKEYAERAITSKKAFLLTELLSPEIWTRSGPDVRPDEVVIRADALCEIADLRAKEGKQRKSLALLLKADKVFAKLNHSTGPALVSLQRSAMQIPRSKPKRARLKDRILKVKSALEEKGYLAGSIRALLLLYEIAQLDNDHDFRVELNRDFRRLNALRGSSLQWFYEMPLIIKRLMRTSDLETWMILAFEGLYAEMSDPRVEVPAKRAMVAHSLFEHYEKFGDVSKAALWKQRSSEGTEWMPEHSRLFFGADTFFEVLQATTTAPDDPEHELVLLQRELQRMVAYMDPEEVAPDQAFVGILKLVLVCDTYMNQVSFRGFDNVFTLVNTALEVSGRLITLLPNDKRKAWRSRVQQIRGRLLFTNACSGQRIDLPALQTSISAYQRALAGFRKVGDDYQAAMVSQNLAVCYRALWVSEPNERKGRSPYFGAAVTHFKYADDIVTATASLSSRRLSKHSLLSHWFQGDAYNVQYGRMRPLWRWLGVGILWRVGELLGSWPCLPQPLRNRPPLLFLRPYEEAIKVLYELEALLDRERLGMSALPHHEAILAKQHLRKDAQVEDVITKGYTLFIARGQNKLVWTWTQSNKSRSISDLLGIGNNIPPHLQHAVNTNPILVELLATERRLEAELQSASRADGMFIGRELHRHRTLMRQYDTLAEILDLREGKPVDWERLHRLKTHNALAQARKTWFVDWIRVHDDLFVTIVPDDKETYFLVKCEGVTYLEVEDWVKQHVDGAVKPLNYDNAAESTAALLQLRPLVYPILDIAKEDELLVLCPTGALHRVPIHAAVIDGGENRDPHEFTTLIDRHPVVYSSSLTLFERGMNATYARSQSAATRGDGPELRGRVLGVYERDPEKQSNVQERKAVYGMCRDVAEDMEWGDAICGKEVSAGDFQAALGADAMLFYGHYVSDRETNVLEHGIELGHHNKHHPLTVTATSSVGKESTPETTTAPATTAAAQDDADTLKLFTVADMFTSSSSSSSSLSSSLPGMQVAARHVTLMACGSTRQAVSGADDPFGFVTALQYAGVPSVTGTMWGLASRYGRELAGGFWNAVREAAERWRRRRRRREGEEEDGDDDPGVVDLAGAVRELVREMRRGEWAGVPYGWAGFVLHGAWWL